MIKEEFLIGNAPVVLYGAEKKGDALPTKEKVDFDKLLRTSAEKIHTTPLGKERIVKNLKLNCEDPVAYCKKLISDEKCVITRRGKNYYCQSGNAIITIKAYSFTIITAALNKNPYTKGEKL